MSLQTTWPKMGYSAVHQFAADQDFVARVALGFGTNWLIGCQYTCVKSDEVAWDYWRSGRWRGPVPLRSIPAQLSITGALMDDSNEASPIANVVSGAVIHATFAPLYGGANSVEWRVYSCATGAYVGGMVATTNALALPALATGSYALWVRYADFLTDSISPAQYQALVGISLSPSYVYAETVDGTSRQSFWDYTRNIGRLPSDTSSPLYAARTAVLVAGTQLDRPEWAAYLVSGTTLESEWSMLRVNANTSLEAGAFVVAPGIRPSPGQVLYSKPFSSLLSDSVTEIVFDVAARSVSALAVGIDGKLLLAGNRSGTNGPQIALWEYDGTNYTLLGLNANLSSGKCECALSSHDCGSVLQTPDGTIYVLSKCSLHRYDPSGATFEDRLPGVPLASNGEPGGQNLCLDNDTLYWLTEYFGGGAALPGATTTQFYNTLQSLSLAAGSGFSGVGTLFHGPNSMVRYRDALVGIVQDKPALDPTAQGRLAEINGTQWDNNAPAWSAGVINLQSLQGGQGLLFCFGAETATQLALAAIYDPSAEMLQFCQFPYRVRRLSQFLYNGADCIAFTGKLPSSNTDDLTADGWVIGCIPINGSAPGGGGTSKNGLIHFCMHWNGTDFSAPLTGLNGFDATTLPLYLTFLPVVGTPGYWLPSVAAPALPYLQKIVTSDHLLYDLHGTQPYSFAGYDNLCFTDGAGGAGTGPNGTPEPSCTSAACVIGNMPAGTKYMLVRVDVTSDWFAASVHDAQSDQSRPIAQILRDYPVLWACFEGDPTDLASYIVPIPFCDELGRFNFPRTLTAADSRFHVCYLLPPTITGASYPIEAFVVAKRD